MRVCPFRLCTSAPQDLRVENALSIFDRVWNTCAWVVYHVVVEYVNSYFGRFGSDNVYYVRLGEAGIGVGSMQGRGWHIGTSLGVFVEGNDYVTTRDSGWWSDGRKL